MSRRKNEFLARYVMVIMLNYIPRFNFVYLSYNVFEFILSFQGLGLGLTLTLTLKQRSLTKRYTPTPRFTGNRGDWLYATLPLSNWTQGTGYNVY